MVNITIKITRLKLIEIFNIFFFYIRKLRGMAVIFKNQIYDLRNFKNCTNIIRHLKLNKITNFNGKYYIIGIQHKIEN